MVDWDRLGREVGKALIAGIAGGIVAGKSLNDNVGIIELAIQIAWVYIMAVIAFVLYEYIFGQPRGGGPTKIDEECGRTATEVQFAS